MEISTPDKNTTANGCSYDAAHLLATISWTTTTTPEVNAWLYAVPTAKNNF